MDKHSLQLIEYPRVLEKVAGYAVSEEGRSILLALEPSTERVRIERVEAAVNGLIRLIREQGVFPSPGYADLESLCHSLENPRYRLSPEELSDSARFLAFYEDFCRWCGRAASFSPTWKKLQEDRPDLSDLRASFGRIIDGEGRLREDRIPELARLRKDLITAEQEAEKLVSAYLKNGASCWRSDKPALHEGRLVLSVKAASRSRIPGVVHRSSGTGETVYMEPPDLMEGNNRIAYIESAYHQALITLLQKKTDALRGQLSEIRRARTLLGEWDAFCARARYGIRVDGCFPLRGKAPCIRGGCHPLLSGKVVPVDIEFPPGRRLIVLSGPNAGGKTVAMKMLGLASALVQSGIPFPMKDGSILPVFQNWLVCLGDEQSIEQARSTFSSTLSRLVLIEREMDADALVLIDELGSGTNPLEGGALGAAFLEELLDRGGYALVTSHIETVKQFAFTAPEAENASTIFDEENGHPLYRIQPGIPGESHAFQLAAQCGLDHRLIQRARELCPRSQTDQLLEALSREELRQRELAADLERRKRSVKEGEKALEERSQALLEREKALRERGIEEIKTLVARVEDELQKAPSRGRTLLGELKSQQSVEYRKNESIEQTLNLRYAGTYRAGDRVRIGSNPGKLIRRNRKGDWEVQTGSFTLVVPEYKLLPEDSSVEEDSGGRAVRIEVESSEAVSTGPIDVRGLRSGEALEAVDRRIDRLRVAGILSLEIIHGTGTGALMRSVTDFLKSHPAVAEVHFADPRFGGMGKSCVVLKDASGG